jgi:hypothetical protein
MGDSGLEIYSSVCIFVFHQPFSLFKKHSFQLS